MAEYQKLLEQMRRDADENFVPVMKRETETELTRVLTETRPKHILEIGTAIGFSGIIMLAACPDAVLNTIEYDEVRATAAAENFAAAGCAARANIFLGDAKEIIRELTGMYDFVFMDGPKASYGEFLPYLLDVLNTGGIIFCDNVGYMGLTQRAGTLPKRHKHITIARNMAKFVKEITSRADLETKLDFCVGDGIAVIKKSEPAGKNG